MWYLELFGELTDINIIDVTSSESILTDLETALDTEYPDDFPYGCNDVEIIDSNDSYIEIVIIFEDHHAENERYQTLIRKV